MREGVLPRHIPHFSGAPTPLSHLLAMFPDGTRRAALRKEACLLARLGKHTALLWPPLHTCHTLHQVQQEDAARTRVSAITAFNASPTNQHLRDVLIICECTPDLHTQRSIWHITLRIAAICCAQHSTPSHRQ